MRLASSSLPPENMMKAQTIALLAVLLVLAAGTPTAHSASLVSNGTFDDWTVGDTVSVNCPGLLASGINLSTDIVSSFVQPAILPAPHPSC